MRQLISGDVASRNWSPGAVGVCAHMKKIVDMRKHRGPGCHCSLALILLGLMSVHMFCIWFLVWQFVSAIYRMIATKLYIVQVFFVVGMLDRCNLRAWLPLFVGFDFARLDGSSYVLYLDFGVAVHVCRRSVIDTK